MTGSGGSGGCAQLQVKPGGTPFDTSNVQLLVSGQYGGAGQDLIDVTIDTSPGSYDLSNAASSLNTCSANCAFFGIDVTNTNSAATKFMAVQGTLDIEQTNTQSYFAFSKGSLTGVRFEEVSKDPGTGVYSLVPGGACYTLASATFDFTGWSADCAVNPNPASAPSGGSCVSGGSCNPVTGFGCNLAAGETCDHSDQNGGYACYPPPNNAVLCGACNGSSGPYCKAGMGCSSTAQLGKCYRYCCIDADCGVTGTCVTTPKAGGVGVCLDAP